MGIRLTHANARFGNLLLILLFLNFVSLVELKKLDRFQVQMARIPEETTKSKKPLALCSVGFLS